MMLTTAGSARDTMAGTVPPAAWDRASVAGDTTSVTAAVSTTAQLHRTKRMPMPLSSARFLLLEQASPAFVALNGARPATSRTNAERATDASGESYRLRGGGARTVSHALRMGTVALSAAHPSS